MKLPPPYRMVFPRSPSPSPDTDPAPPCIADWPPFLLQVVLQFTEEAIREIARVGAYVNKTVENIGARRLHTVLERIVEVSEQALRALFFF